MIFVIFLQEQEENYGILEDDPINFLQATKSSSSHRWVDALKEKYNSMEDNKFWELVPLPKGARPIGCKWIFKTNQNSKGNVERYKVCILAKGFT